MLSKKIDLDSSIFEQSFPTDNDLDILNEVNINKYKDTVEDVYKRQIYKCWMRIYAKGSMGKV